jgi:hypothetical protein
MNKANTILPCRPTSSSFYISSATSLANIHCYFFLRELTTHLQAGEDLEEIEEEYDEAVQDREVIPPTLSEAEAALTASITLDRDLAKPVDYNERTPLMSSSSVIKDRSRSRQRRRRAGSVASHGDATVVQAVLMVRPNPDEYLAFADII